MDNKTRTRSMPIALLVMVGVLAAVLLSPAQAAGGKAYQLPNGHWVQDYYNPVRRNFLDMVISAHYNKVGQRMHARKFAHAVSDLSYTLEHIPNHPLALRQATIVCQQYPQYLTCDRSARWFKRALQFTPKDANARLLYGIHLHQMGDPNAAVKQYTQAIRLRPGFADAHYNLALIYVDKNQYGNAKKHAKLAYKHGHRAPGLKRHLKNKGYW